MSSPSQSVPIGKKNDSDYNNNNHNNNNSNNNNNNEDENDNQSTSSRPGSLFQPGTSPFRQASMRLGSPVPSMGMKGAAAGMSPVQRPLDDDEEFDDYGVEEEEQDDPSLTTPLDPRTATMQRRGSPSISNQGGSSPVPAFNDSSAQSVRSIDIENPDPEVVKVVGRHLVKDNDSIPNGQDSTPTDPQTGAEDKFASLKLQGGDITRQLYNWQREHEVGESSTKRGRSRSVDIPRPLPKDMNDEPIDIKNIKAPGGFRRNFIIKKAHDEDPESLQANPAFLTRNFIEFLSIYGHFAGEYLEEDEDDDSSTQADDDETTSLLHHQRQPSGQRRARRKSVQQGGNATVTKVVMLLLKSFVGSGVLFLPHAFLNGGILFSSMIMCLVSLLSYWCFLLLIRAKDAVGGGSFGDVGGVLYGPKMRQVILTSIVLSQVGFSAAYFVFTSENLQALIWSWSGHQTKLSIEFLIVAQLFLFLPLSWIRDIAKLSGTALVADFFIFLGLLYLYFWGLRTISVEGVADIKLFNPKLYTLFLGTAIFTYEGVGLIIPIEQSMKEPAKFPRVLGWVLVAITTVFVSMGAISYAAYGSTTRTVVILNLPQDSGFVNGIQLLYSLAIVLSTPLQLFPAIRILENGLFVRSGKYNKKVKWQKNMFRLVLVTCTAMVSWAGADDLDKFVSLTGSVACVPLVYIYPPLLHMKAVHNQPWKYRMADIALCCLGVSAMLFTTAGTIKSWISSD